MHKVAEFRTERFTLRPLQRSDAAALFPTLSDPEQCRYLSRDAFASEEELWGWLTEPSWPGRTWIAEDAGGAVAGRFVAYPGEHEGIEEIGYITCADRQGQGIASECAAALITHLFSGANPDLPPRKLIADVDARNLASVKVLEKLGFTREAHFRQHEMTHAGLCDVYWYGLLREEWKV